MQEILYISVLQILGPLFVILGHSLNGIDASGGWYIFSKQWIYFFHMPLFFMISGYLLSFKGYSAQKSYREFVYKKFKRLMIPYIFWNIVSYVPKLFFQEIVNDSVPLEFSEVVKAFLFPRQNIWGHTWFLAALFFIYLATPFWKKIFTAAKKYQIVAICIGILLYVFPVKTEFLCFSDLHKDVLFFMLGCFLGSLTKDQFCQAMKKNRLFYTIAALILSAVFLIWYNRLEPLRFIPCTFILLSLFSSATYAEKLKRFPPQLSDLAKRAFGIYIMHWPVMIAVRTVCQILHVDTIITVILMTLFGCIVPNIIIWLFRKIKLDRIEIFRYLLGV
ncbi:acyltransferase family protein [Acetivibrio sp. MSJd-27]|uniref:acyltransferase family protein n=1 Tax=Acetivibrio sp. MSJd-27 TaxID=2841523 RepID=UPI001C104B89|nr:acyltransferase [Acetivibrio sp. MSJd-27]MBU5450133.1 acyltransferase [Acetivibrio sp. MSJd-27]